MKIHIIYHYTARLMRLVVATEFGIGPEHEQHISPAGVAAYIIVGISRGFDVTIITKP